MRNKTLNEYLEQLKIYVQQSNYIDSIDLLNRAISQYPEENNLKLNLGNIYKLLERNDDAVKIFSILENSELADLANNNLSLIFLILVIIGGSFFSTSSGSVSYTHLRAHET